MDRILEARANKHHTCLRPEGSPERANFTSGKAQQGRGLRRSRNGPTSLIFHDLRLGRLRATHQIPPPPATTPHDTTPQFWFKVFSLVLCWRKWKPPQPQHQLQRTQAKTAAVAALAGCHCVRASTVAPAEGPNGLLCGVLAALEAQAVPAPVIEHVAPTLAVAAARQ